MASQSLTSIFGMSKRTIFNWLGIVSYDAPALHQAIAEKKLGLQHALVFRDYPPAITEAWVERCIEGEWSSRELKLELSAVDETSRTTVQRCTVFQAKRQTRVQRCTVNSLVNRCLTVQRCMVMMRRSCRSSSRPVDILTGDPAQIDAWTRSNYRKSKPGYGWR